MTIGCRDLGKPSAKHEALMSLELYSPLTYTHLPQILIKAIIHSSQTEDDSTLRPIS